MGDSTRVDTALRILLNLNGIAMSYPWQYYKIKFKLFMMKNYILISFLILSACASSTDSGAIGVKRKQLSLVSGEEIMHASAQEYEKVKQEAKSKGELDKNPAMVQRLQQISKKIIPQTAVFRKDAPAWSWEVHALTSDQLNAYCMPGGKIMFYTGIIEKLNLTDGEIAAIMGHEISHALREHGSERMSEELLKNIAIAGLVMSRAIDSKYAGVANLLATGVTLKYDRDQESEADEIGMELMARAGYDPNEAVNLWHKMSAVGGGKPPEILSTHPSDSRRIKDMQALLPKTLPLYQKTVGKL